MFRMQTDPAGKSGAGTDLLAGDLFPDTEFRHTAQRLAERHRISLSYARFVLHLLRGGRDDR